MLEEELEMPRRCTLPLPKQRRSSSGSKLSVSFAIYTSLTMGLVVMHGVTQGNNKNDVMTMNRAKYGVEEMCRDLWNWASKNPNGYGSSDNGH